MIFTRTILDGVYTLDLEPRGDARGFFARTFCAREFAEHGLVAMVAQCSVAYNSTRGTIRGLHFQHAPAAEAKLVRCTSGSIHDVVVDLRPDSDSYLQHVGVELSAENRRGLYIPEGLAHGYQTLTDGAEVYYQMSEFYAPGHGDGVRYDDPALAITWPLAVSAISERDRTWPLLGAAHHVSTDGITQHIAGVGQ